MAVIPIPTGLHTVTYTASRRSFLYYQCAKCGNSALAEYLLKQAASGSYHVFQSKDKKEKTRTSAQEQAAQLIDRVDEALFQEINREHRCDSINQKVTCPRCGAVQPWSGFPVEWKKSTNKGLWIFGLVFLGIFSAAMLATEPAFGAVLAAVTVLVALIPVFRKSRRSKRQRALEAMQFVRPIYYNKTNLQELLQGPNADLLRPYLK